MLQSFHILCTQGHCQAEFAARLGDMVAALLRDMVAVLLRVCGHGQLWAALGCAASLGGVAPLGIGGRRAFVLAMTASCQDSVHVKA